jgi:selenocysteine-specific elongation factor
MYVIGTAGHVDHGKSTLVKALTGIDPDRLAEEKAREMTIDLGFAWLELDGLVGEVGVVDVPGHRDFIENMLAGVGGIDLALLVIAADEGVMPQTREHLAILDLLGVHRGIVVITKSDLVEDADWLELVMLDVSEVLADTALADAPLIPVSAHTGAGLAELKAQLTSSLRETEPRPDEDRPRMPIDRVFTLTGFGTVVTGTLIGGCLASGDELLIQPGGLTARVRGLQTHRTKREVARPGSRVAVNLTGIDRDAVRRGDVLTRAGVVEPTRLIDVAYRHLADAEQPLKHNVAVKLFLGSAEIPARTRILGREQIDPGQSGWLQLRLEQPAVALRGDRLILRRPSPGATIGGGHVLDPHPGRQHRRFRPETAARLHALAQGTPEELLLQAVQRHEPVSVALLRQKGGVESADFDTALANLLQHRRLHDFEGQLVTWSSLQRRLDTLITLLDDHHRNFPLRVGISREEVRSRLKLKAAVFNPLVTLAAGQGLLVEAGAWLHRPDHAVRFTPAQEQRIAALLAEFAAAGINSPSVKQAREAVGDDVYQALVERGDLVAVNQEVVWRRADYDEWVAAVRSHLAQHGTIATADLRDRFQTSRKYAIALLEHLDYLRITRRVGDNRELIPRS